MKIEGSFADRTYRYRLVPAADDPREFGQQTNPAERLRRVRDEYEVRLPERFTHLHPDAHAVAIWLALAPMIRSVLELPFAVSRSLAAGMERRFRVRLPNVDDALRPRVPPENPRPVLLFSGGVDSLAGALLMPRDTALLFLDRIPHFHPGQSQATCDQLIDLQGTRELCARLSAAGFDVVSTRDDHDHLHVPYPRYHSVNYHLSALYLADSLGLAELCTADVLCAVAFGGYRGDVSSVRFRRSPALTGAPMLEQGPDGTVFEPYGELLEVGMKWRLPTIGLSEVATALVVNRSPFKGMATSCYNPSPTNYCWRCDKCFKKMLLDYVFDGREVPADLFEGFLRVPVLARIFRRPFFDWHHVWYYLFQKMRCPHPLAVELRRQAQAGPDLSLLEKWYPPARDALPEARREEIAANIARHVEPMTGAEQARLESLEIPPLVAPRALLEPYLR